MTDRRVFIKSLNGAGNVGEYIESVVAVTVTGATSDVALNVTSISLGAGDWDVFGMALALNAGVTTWTKFKASISQTSATQGAESAQSHVFVITGGDPPIPPLLVVPTLRVLLTATTTIYLVATVTFSGSTFGVGGRLSARRAAR